MGWGPEGGRVAEVGGWPAVETPRLDLEKGMLRWYQRLGQGSVLKVVLGDGLLTVREHQLAVMAMEVLVRRTHA